MWSPTWATATTLPPASSPVPSPAPTSSPTTSSCAAGMAPACGLTSARTGRAREVLESLEPRAMSFREHLVLSPAPPAPMALMSPPEEVSVSVMVRVRPLAPGERQRATQHPVLHVANQHLLIFNPEEPAGPSGSVLPTRGPKHQGKNLKFFFDRVFDEQATQEEVFQHTTRDLLDSFLKGYNCSVFAYGATGAGKTHTMLGTETSPGIMYLTMLELYRRMEARKKEQSCEILVSYLEVYNEQIHDLLEPKGPLSIQEDPKKGVLVPGISFHQPQSAEQLLEMLAKGNKNRTQHPTDANATSSRSHAIFQIYLKQQDRACGHAQGVQVAKMSLIDLAGSERASVANTKGQRLREGANINRSLLALINVINALAEAKSRRHHIPFRDSKLTRLLKDSLSGNCRTILLAALSPSVLCSEDTYNTLVYANRAKEIRLSLKSNVLPKDSSSTKAPGSCENCERLRAEVAELRAKLQAYEQAAERSQKVLKLLAPLSSSSVELPSSPRCCPSRSNVTPPAEPDSPVRAMNVTFEICRVSISPMQSTSPCPIGPELWESIQKQLREKQDSSLMAKTHPAVVPSREASIPQASPVCTAPGPKRKRAQSTSCPIVAVPQSCSKKICVQPSCMPASERTPAPVPRKGSKRITRKVAVLHSGHSAATS